MAVVTSQSHEVLASFRKVSVGSDRKFGLTVGAILAALSLLPLLHGKPPRPWLLALGLVLFGLGLLAPRALGPLNRLWFRFGLLLGQITNPIVMGILFFLVMVPMGWILRRRGHDLLSLRRDGGADTYWIAREPQSARSSLKNQF